MPPDWNTGWLILPGLDAAVQARLVTALLVLLLLFLANRALRRLVQARVADARLRYGWQKAISYLTLALMLLFLVQIGLGGLTGTATFLGLLTAGLAIALRDPIVSLIAWTFLLVSRPFAIGDRIQIGAVAGDVVDLGLFQFSLLEIGNWVDADQSTGRVLHLPNSRIFSETIANYTAGYRYIWNELPLTLTLDSDWRRATNLLQQIANRHAQQVSEAAQEEVRAATRKFMIQYNRLTPTVYLDLDPLGIRLTVRYLCEPRQRRTSADALWQDILTTLAAEPNIRLVQGTLWTEGSGGAAHLDGV